ncbi:hypothetical protein HPB48_024582 [Haemaphysalis longicornis]|uniref:adenine phosphoribosyltransferase n=1 Tax=Haemaphysalis longicornis TaxID=44386 RepID=A0A9J6H6V3_HAELO|nr:hypothetical protein HPB48_024582 [Haemaphysalis longicornis]
MDRSIEEIRAKIKTYPDFPKKGIIYRDMMPLFQNPDVFHKVVNLLVEQVRKTVREVHAIAGLEARGFLLGPSLALALNVPFVPVRKAGKLPGDVRTEAYTLEYGKAAGGKVPLCLVIMELEELKGRQAISAPLFSAADFFCSESISVGCGSAAQTSKCTYVQWK